MSQQKITEKVLSLLEWLDEECPKAITPYMNNELSHDFTEGLRKKLDEIKNESLTHLNLK